MQKLQGSSREQEACTAKAAAATAVLFGALLFHGVRTFGGIPLDSFGGLLKRAFRRRFTVLRPHVWRVKGLQSTLEGGDDRPCHLEQSVSWHCVVLDIYVR